MDAETPSPVSTSKLSPLSLLGLGHDEAGNPLTDEQRTELMRWAWREIAGLRWCVRMLWEEIEIIDSPRRTWRGEKVRTRRLEDVVVGGNAKYAHAALRATSDDAAEG